MAPMPDAEIFPHATGAAEKTVAAHQETCDLVYHGSWFCPFVQVLLLSMSRPSLLCSVVESAGCLTGFLHCALGLLKIDTYVTLFLPQLFHLFNQAPRFQTAQCVGLQRGWIALQEKGIKYQWQEVNPYKNFCMG